MRLPTGSAIRTSPRSLVDDRVFEATDLEQRRYAAHRLGVSQADEATRHQAVEQVLRCQASGRVIEIDQHVAAEDDIEFPVLASLRRLHEVHGRELYGLAQIGN